jgi:hypothetical protein
MRTTRELIERLDPGAWHFVPTDTERMDWLEDGRNRLTISLPDANGVCGTSSPTGRKTGRALARCTTPPRRATP